jgi:hypothetical protein
VINEDIETPYKDVWELVYPKVANENKGVLYQVIHILLEAEKLRAYDICTATGINKNASLSDDERIAGDQLLMEKPNPLNQFFKQKNWLTKKMDDTLRNNFNNSDMATVAWLVFIGSLLVGAAVCIQYTNKKSNARNRRGNGRNLQPDSLWQLSPEPITAALCLVVPASVFIDLRDKHPNGFTNNCLDTSDLKMLIDNASYFLCTDVNKVASKEQFLEMTSEEIPSNSNREVYIRVDINPGQEMIDKESPYILKRNLPNYGQRIIQKYACLRNLSGLENFNRI